MGVYSFTSASTGQTKKMWVFAAEVIDASDFFPANKIADTTAARKWMPAAEFAERGRIDHRPIISDLHHKITTRFKR